MAAEDDELTADIIVTAVEDCLRRHFSPLAARVAVIEGATPISEVDVKAIAKELIDAARGPQGERGEAGPVGERGEPGENGKSITLEDVSPLIAGEVAKAIAAIELPVGPAGAAGEPGQKGEAGHDGKDGAPGERGVKGEDGRDGRDGAEGVAGKDAAELVVIQSIDPERTYGVGTWARASGGLVRAARDTDPLARAASHTDAGWSVMVDGIATLSIGPADEHGRSFAIEATLTSGRKEVSTITTAVPLDQGVYKPDREYVKGDGVTFNGSFWIAQAQTSDRPGTSPSWRLAVKAGRDGKDVRPDGTIHREPVRLR